MGAHDFDAVLVDPNNKTARVGEADSADRALTGMQNGILAGVLTKADRAQPARGGGGGAISICISTDARLSANCQDQIARKTARKISPVILVVWRQSNALTGRAKLRRVTSFGSTRDDTQTCPSMEAVAM